MSDRLTVDGDVISQRAALQSGLITNFQFQAGDGSFLYNNQNEINGFCRRNKSWNKLSQDWKNNSPYVKMGNNIQSQLAIKNPNANSVLLDTTNYEVNTIFSAMNNDVGLIRVTNNRIGYTCTMITINSANAIYVSGANFPIVAGQTGYFTRNYNAGTGAYPIQYGALGTGAATVYVTTQAGGTGCGPTAISGIYGTCFDNFAASPIPRVFPNVWVTFDFS